MKYFKLFENFLNEAMRESSKEYNDMRYEIWYQAPRGYFAKGIGEMKGKIETSYFETSEEAEEHAEAEIDGYLGESLSENINDPVLVALRASKEERKKSAAEQAAMMKKRVYGKQREKLENDLMDIAQDLKDLYSDKRSALSDMEAEAGEKGNDWTDEDANRYGDILNKIDDNIEVLLQKRQELEIKLAY